MRFVGEVNEVISEVSEVIDEFCEVVAEVICRIKFKFVIQVIEK